MSIGYIISDERHSASEPVNRSEKISNIIRFSHLFTHIWLIACISKGSFLPTVPRMAECPKSMAAADSPHPLQKFRARTPDL